MGILRRLEQRGKQGGSHDEPPIASVKAALNAIILVALATRLRTELHARLDPAIFENPTPTARRTIEDLLEALLKTILAEEHAEENFVLKLDEKRMLFDALVVEILVGFGPFAALLTDDNVFEIMVNGPQTIYINRKGRLMRANIAFENEEHVLRILNRMLEPLQRRIDAAHPIIDVRLPDHSHLYAVAAPIARDGPTITIRKFSRKPFTVPDLIRFGSMTDEIAEFLRASVIARLNIIVSGGVKSGKTTLLNVLASFIPNDERIFVIEDGYELQLRQEHVISWNARPPDMATHPETTTGRLAIQARGMMADRIVIGECRAGEARDIIQAMQWGDGCLMTMIAENAPDTLSRLETLGDPKPSTAAIRSQIASTINLIVQIDRWHDGSRKITSISEIQGMEGGTVRLAEIFKYDDQSGVTATKIMGRFQPTGV